MVLVPRGYVSSPFVLVSEMQHIPLFEIFPLLFLSLFAFKRLYSMLQLSVCYSIAAYSDAILRFFELYGGVTEGRLLHGTATFVLYPSLGPAVPLVNSSIHPLLVQAELTCKIEKVYLNEVFEL